MFCHEARGRKRAQETNRVKTHCTHYQWAILNLKARAGDLNSAFQRCSFPSRTAFSSEGATGGWREKGGRVWSEAGKNKVATHCGRMQNVRGNRDFTSLLVPVCVGWCVKRNEDMKDMTYIRRPPKACATSTTVQDLKQRCWLRLHEESNHFLTQNWSFADLTVVNVCQLMSGCRQMKLLHSYYSVITM